MNITSEKRHIYRDFEHEAPEFRRNGILLRYRSSGTQNRALNYYYRYAALPDLKNLSFNSMSIASEKRHIYRGLNMRHLSSGGTAYNMAFSVRELNYAIDIAPFQGLI